MVCRCPSATQGRMCHVLAYLLAKRFSNNLWNLFAQQAIGYMSLQADAVCMFLRCRVQLRVP